MIKLLSLGTASQLVFVLVGVFRTPIIISALGVNKFGTYVAVLGCWAVLAAVGEGYRARMRQLDREAGIKFSDLILQYLRSSWIAIFSFLPAVALLLFASFQERNSIDWPLFFLVTSLGYLYPLFSGAVGFIEAKAKFMWFHASTIIAQVFSLAAVFAVASQKNVYLFALATLLPAFIPGLIAILRMVSSSETISNNNLQDIHSHIHKYSLVLVFETLAFSLDSTLVLAFLGAQFAAEFAITQRIMFVYAIVPVVLAPLVAHKGGRGIEASWIRKIQLKQTLFAALISIFVVTFSPWAIVFLSGGLLEPNFWLIFAGCLNGLVGAFASTHIQAASSEAAIGRRLTGTILLFVSSTITSILLFPVLGLVAPFVGTIVGTIFYWYISKKTLER